MDTLDISPWGEILKDAKKKVGALLLK